jgi:hypothetical protein
VNGGSLYGEAVRGPGRSLSRASVFVEALMSESKIPDHAYPNALPNVRAMFDHLKAKVVLFLLRDLRV